MLEAEYLCNTINSYFSQIPIWANHYSKQLLSTEIFIYLMNSNNVIMSTLACMSLLDMDRHRGDNDMRY